MRTVWATDVLVDYGQESIVKSTTKNRRTKALEIDVLCRAFRFVLQHKAQLQQVLEARCGNGFILCALSRVFSVIRFGGLDRMDGMIDNAKNRPTWKNVRVLITG